MENEKKEKKNERIDLFLNVAIVLLSISGTIIWLIFLVNVYYTSRTGKLDKPILYFYPEEETELVVNFGKPELLTTTYPKYENEWEVTAYPDGNLIEKGTNKKLYSLYYVNK